MTRDPRHDPREGDELPERWTSRIAIVDLVRDGQVYYRVTQHGALVAALRTPLDKWRQCAARQCAAVVEVGRDA